MRLINAGSVFLALLFSPASPALAYDTFLADFEARSEQRAADLEVKVTDRDGRPMASASVMVGQAKGNPFAGNVAETDATGTAAFSDEALRTGQPYTVTVSRAGHTTVSLVNNRHNAVQVSLARNPEERGHAFLRGRVLGFPGTSSGTLEMGFFVPAARAENLLNFDINSIVSSYEVELDLYGKQKVPGNVVLPTQRKFWGIVPINVSKPDFIMPLALGTNTHMYALSGGIDISKAVRAVQNKDFLEVLNLASLTRVGWTPRRVEVKGNETFDLQVTHQVTPNQLTAQISGVRGKADAVAISLVDPTGDEGDFVAMDIKSLKSENMQNGSGSVRLGLVRQGVSPDKLWVFTALFDKQKIDSAESRWVVGSVRPVQRRATVPFTKYLNPIQPVSVSPDKREYRFSNPANGALAPDTLLLNVVSEKFQPETNGWQRTVLWSAVVNGSTDKVTLPDLGRAILPAPDSSRQERFHWEVVSFRAGDTRAQGWSLKNSLRNLKDVSSLLQKY